MATQVIEILSDSLDERIKTGVETVTFFNPLDGTRLEIELGEANRKHFSNHLDKLVKYIAAAREVVEAKPARKAAGSKSDLSAVREWARANGFEVGDRGRIKAEILEAFDKAQMPDSVKVTLEVASEPAVEAPEAISDEISEPEGTETQGEQDEAPENSSEASDEDQDLMEFLMANMDKDGKVHAQSLAGVTHI